MLQAYWRYHSSEDKRHGIEFCFSNLCSLWHTSCPLTLTSYLLLPAESPNFGTQSNQWTADHCDRPLSFLIFLRVPIHEWGGRLEGIATGLAGRYNTVLIGSQDSELIMHYNVKKCSAYLYLGVCVHACLVHDSIMAQLCPLLQYYPKLCGAMGTATQPISPWWGPAGMRDWGQPDVRLLLPWYCFLVPVMITK